MKKFIAILFLFSAIALLLGGCAYYYPYDYDPSYYPDNYGFIGPYYNYSPYGYYSYYPYPYSYQYAYPYYYPYTRFYFGGGRDTFTERRYEPTGKPMEAEKEGRPPAK